MSEPDIKDAVSVVRNRRTDAMFVAAYLAVIGMIYVVVYEPKISEYAQGVLTLCIGNFIGYLTSMYSFETGTTRSSAKKDEAINELTKTAAAAATPVVTPASAIVPAAVAETVVPAIPQINEVKP
jgi:hypothetical protein